MLIINNETIEIKPCQACWDITRERHFFRGADARHPRPQHHCSWGQEETLQTVQGQSQHRHGHGHRPRQASDGDEVFGNSEGKCKSILSRGNLSITVLNLRNTRDAWTWSRSWATRRSARRRRSRTAWEHGTSRCGRTTSYSWITDRIRQTWETLGLCACRLDMAGRPHWSRITPAGTTAIRAWWCRLQSIAKPTLVGCSTPGRFRPMQRANPASITSPSLQSPWSFPSALKGEQSRSVKNRKSSSNCRSCGLSKKAVHNSQH